MALSMATYCDERFRVRSISRHICYALTEATQAIADIEAILKKLEHPQVQEFTADEEPIPF